MLRIVLPVLATFAAGSAFAAIDPGTSLPAEHHQGAIAYVSGGIGEAESTAMKHAAHHYPLELIFASRRRGHDDYLADVPLTIKSAKGGVVFRGKADGPYFLARLPSGKYTITSSNDGQSITRRIEVKGNGTQRVVFEWKGHRHGESA